MKMRLVSLVLVLFMLVLTLTSCGTESAEAGLRNPFSDRFKEYSSGFGRCVIVDEVTGVCYLYRCASGNGGLTVMLDEDGTPLTYEEALSHAE